MQNMAKEPALAAVPHKDGFGHNLALVFAMVLTMTWAHRLAGMTVYYFNNINFAWHFQAVDGFNPVKVFFSTYWQAMALGLKTDALFAIAGALILAPFGRVARYAGLVILAFFYAANTEHIRFNESNLDLQLIGLAANPTFIAGQTTVTLFQAFAFFVLVGGALLWFARRRRIRLTICVAAPLIAGIAIVAPATARYDHPVWMQTHPAMPRLGIPDLPVDDRAFSSDAFTDHPLPDPTIAGKHNVLLVFLEGISEHSLAISDMSDIQQIAAENIHFRQYIGHQLLTANGIYSTHTARLPYFTNVPMRWYDMDQTSPELQTALPRLLSEKGYQTSFIQAAPLSFMRKDEKLPLLGYETIIGAENITKAHSRNGWGVDDLTLVETTLSHIDQLDPNHPWLTSILTTGTHSPYNVPADFLPDASLDRYRASRYADEAMAALIEGLDQRGLLENTVVIITSDESREYSSGTQLETDLHRSWLPFIVVHPNQMNEQIDAPFAMIDVRDMILAATGDLTRSAIDAIANRRDTFVTGNVRLDQLFHFNKTTETLFACNTHEFICFEYSGVTDLRDLNDIELENTARYQNLELIVRKLEGQEVECEYDIAVCE